MSATAARMRRVPQQERSRQKIQTLLDVADGMLARDGAGALNTTRVAEAAGVSVGTLYQYFPDKEAIAEALARRHWEDLAAIVTRLAEERPGKEPVGAVLTAMADGFRARPGFRGLWFGGLRTERIRDVTRPTRDQVAEALERMLAAHRPEAPPAARAKVARMLTLTGDGLLREAFRLDPRGDQTVLDEGRTMLEAYVEARLG